MRSLLSQWALGMTKNRSQDRSILTQVLSPLSYPNYVCEMTKDQDRSFEIPTLPNDEQMRQCSLT